jgi:hypothetical protein
MLLRVDAPREDRILDFDIENRPLTYLGNDRTTAEITAIACSFGIDKPMYCWLLGEGEPEDMLCSFVMYYDMADLVTGHYIRKHDLPIINGALLEYGMRPLRPKLTSDTCLDLKATKDISRSQENLSAMLGVEAPKVKMSQLDWRSANRLENIEKTFARVTGDVRQHQQLRLRLLELGMLNPPKMWDGS